MSINPIDYHTDQSEIIEKTLDAFGIRARVSEINDEGDMYRYGLEIVMGTRIDDILALDKDLSLALATVKPVKIIGQEPGRSLITIIVPKTKNSPKTADKQSYKIIHKQEVITKYVTSDLLEQFRRIISALFVFLANGLIKIANKVDSEQEVVWEEYENESDSKSTTKKARS